MKEDRQITMQKVNDDYYLIKYSERSQAIIGEPIVKKGIEEVCNWIRKFFQEEEMS